MRVTRRLFLRSATMAAGTSALRANEKPNVQGAPLEEFSYAAVQLETRLQQAQFEQTQNVLLRLNDDSLLKPFRLRAGLNAPGPEMGGWYDEVPLDRKPSGGHGFAPGHAFGQWISALSRAYAVGPDAQTRVKIERLLALYEPTISERFYTNFRFPAYVYDKLVIGLIDAHEFAGIPNAFRLLDKTTNAALPHLPPKALDRDQGQKAWRQAQGDSTAPDYLWDEPYTLPENLYLAWTRGAGERYKQLAGRFLLDETYFDPLSRGENVLPHHHAYSFCNALSSAMQAYLVAGSEKHLRAASNAFDMIDKTQSFATGGWGPNEAFVEPGSGALYKSLQSTHKSFETPCGSYGHFKLTRYLLRVTKNGKYGDSMERVLYNTVLGAKPLQADGRAFYYSDYNFSGSKVYFPDAWPCCSGTLPQVAADYRKLIYFREPGTLYVNLYLPSTVRWTERGGAEVTLTQRGEYPLAPRVDFHIRISRPASFQLRVRIPGWAARAAIAVNDERVPLSTQNGFATVDRKWRDGDRISLNFEIALRLVPIDAAHPNTVALMRGPLVLMPSKGQPSGVSRDLLLSAQRRSSEPEWIVGSEKQALRLRPFYAIGDEPYTTYVETV